MKFYKKNIIWTKEKKNFIQCRVFSGRFLSFSFFFSFVEEKDEIRTYSYSILKSDGLLFFFPFIYSFIHIFESCDKSS